MNTQLLMTTHVKVGEVRNIGAERAVEFAEPFDSRRGELLHVPFDGHVRPYE